jgi:nucleotide-binding universal stress UspA family protein
VYRQILVWLDDDPGAERVVPWVRGLARRPGAAVCLLAIRPPVAPVTGAGRVVAYRHQLEDAIRADALAGLRAVGMSLREDGIRIGFEVRFGEPVVTILAAARDLRADLIALTAGSPGRGRRSARSIVRRVLFRASVPVLVARRRGQRAA